MTLKIKELGYTLAPGERFIDESDCVSDDEEEDGPELANFAKSEINLENEMLSKIKEIELKPVKGDKKVPWVETLTVLGDAVCDEEIDMNQSAKVEEHFKQLASGFVKTALKRLSDLKIPFNRPSDFYAEMMKSDEHMARILRTLENKQKQLALRKVLRSKKDRKGRKMSRKVVDLQEKNKFIKSVNQIRKGRRDEDIDKKIDKLIATSDEAKTKRIREIKKSKAAKGRKGGKASDRRAGGRKGPKGARNRSSEASDTFKPGRTKKKGSKSSRPGKGGKGPKGGRKRPKGRK